MQCLKYLLARISLKSNYELNSGNYVNSQNLTPEEGLLGIGISASLAKDLLINKRMATLKQLTF